MAIKDVLPGGPQGAQVATYEVPSKVPHQVRTLRVLLLVVGVASIVNVVTSIPGVVELQSNFNEINAVLKDTENFPRLTECRDAGDGVTFYCPVPGGVPPEGVTDAECQDGEDGRLYCTGSWAATVLTAAFFGDSTQIAVNGANLALLVLGTLTLYIPARYLYLWKRAGEGHPHTLRGVRLLALLQIIVEGVKIVGIVYLFSGTDLFSATDFLGAFPLAALLAPFLLLLIRTVPVREYFSAVAYQRVGALPSLRIEATPSWAMSAPSHAQAAAPPGHTANPPPPASHMPAPPASPPPAPPAHGSAPAPPAATAPAWAGAGRRRAAWETTCPVCKAARTVDPCPACGAP